MAEQDDTLALREQFLEFVTIYSEQLKGIYSLMEQQTRSMDSIVTELHKVMTVLGEDPKFRERFNKLMSAPVTKNETAKKEIQKLEAGLAAFLEKNKDKIH